MDLETARALLGLPSTFDAGLVKRHYRQRAKVCHPDLCPNDTAATEKFQALSLAYACLQRHLKSAKPPTARTAADGMTRTTDAAGRSPLNTQEQFLRGKHLQQIKAMVQAGKLLQAIAAIDTLMQRFPQDESLKKRKAWIYYGQARLLLRQGRIAQARKYLNAVLKLAPGDRSLRRRVETISESLDQQQHSG
jgi:tetratricopeptide (TPR) repeat protein